MNLKAKQNCLHPTYWGNPHEYIYFLPHLYFQPTPPSPDRFTQMLKTGICSFRHLLDQSLEVIFQCNAGRNWCPSPYPHFTPKKEGGCPVSSLPSCPDQWSKSNEYVENPTKLTKMVLKVCMVPVWAVIIPQKWTVGSAYNPSYIYSFLSWWPLKCSSEKEW